jgi:hypothetical protein
MKTNDKLQLQKNPILSFFSFFGQWGLGKPKVSDLCPQASTNFGEDPWTGKKCFMEPAFHDEFSDLFTRLFQCWTEPQSDIFFFPSGMADVALWLGPYMSISRKKSICTRTKRVRKCRQITTNQTTQRPARRPANPPARLAFRQEKQQTRHTKGAGAQTKTPTKKICQRTQWFDHCITLKNMRK